MGSPSPVRRSTDDGVGHRRRRRVESWIATGTPPICYATGSIPVESPKASLEMIGAASAQLGERPLLCAGDRLQRGVGSGPCQGRRGDQLRQGFAASKAIVHHGGSGTTAYSLRAGVPTLILWSSADQPYWGNQLERLKVGASRRFSKTTSESLVADLRRILKPDYALRARELATKMTPPSDSIAKAADLFEDSVRRRNG